MALGPGTRLGPYQILAPIGAGGMGEVYRAQDTRLERTVAIKVLPEQLSNDPARRERFEREAKAVSSLNHPHICTLHDVGQANGVDFLVMEYLEGEPLAARLEKGALALEQVLRYGIEIAEALAAAHKHGVIHRDLKPGNVVLTKTGAKLLDFGLAKTHATPAAGPVSELATGTRPLTEAGTLLGTFQYMAPEQLEGKEADARTDLWALGCVLYEMTTGKRPFTGKSQASVIAAILEREPPTLSSVHPMTPPGLDRLVRKCLAKDPDERWDSAHDVADELKWIAGGGPAAGLPAPAPPVRRTREAVAWAVAAAATLVAVLGALPFLRRGTDEGSVTHLVAGIEPAEQLGVSELATVRPGRTAVALSPDGRLLVFSGTQKGVTQLYMRPLDRVEATPLPGSEGGNSPFFSPDGKWIGFWADNKLKKLPLNGGPPVVLCEAAALSRGPVGASWRSGSIAFSLYDRILRVHDSGGDVETVTTIDKRKESGHILPQLLPGGKALLFTLTTSVENWDKADVVVQRLDTGERQTLIRGAADGRYVESGHLLYMKAGTLMAVPFDLAGLQLAGAPAAMLEGVMQAMNMPNSQHESGAAQYCLSSNGTLAYVSGGIHPDPVSSLVWVDRRGVETPLNAPPANYWAPRISPDGRRLAYQIQRPKSRASDIWVHDLARGTPTRLTSQDQNTYPVWSPEGTHLVFSHAAAGRVNLHLIKADGTAAPERLTTNEQVQWANDWSRGANTVAFVQGGQQIWAMPMGEDRQPRPLLQSPAGLGFPDFSPDGRWLAYASPESGRNEIYVRAHPGPGEKHRISTEGGIHPAWSPNGAELFYRSGSKTMVVAVDARHGLSIGQPRLLWERNYRSHNPIRSYDVTPDGQRFIFIKTLSEPEKPFTQIHVVLNWAEELKRRAPAK